MWRNSILSASLRFPGGRHLSLACRGHFCKEGEKKDPFLGGGGDIADSQPSDCRRPPFLSCLRETAIKCCCALFQCTVCSPCLINAFIPPPPLGASRCRPQHVGHPSFIGRTAGQARPGQGRTCRETDGRSERARGRPTLIWLD